MTTGIGDDNAYLFALEKEIIIVIASCLIAVDGDTADIKTLQRWG